MARATNSDTDSSLDTSLSDDEKIRILVQREMMLSDRLKLRRSSLNDKLKIHRAKLVQWFEETCNDVVVVSSGSSSKTSKSSNTRLFTHSVQLLDYFLCKICESVQLPTNLQALGCATILLASKSRKIKIDEGLLMAGSNPAATREVKAWERLLLSELEWDVNLIIPQDYADLLVSILGSENRELSFGTSEGEREAEEGEEENPLQDLPLGSINSRSLSPPTDNNQHPAGQDDKTAVKDADLIATLCSHSPEISIQNPPRMLGLCSAIIATKNESAIPDDLVDTLQLDKERVQGVLTAMQIHLDDVLPPESLLCSPSKQRMKTPSPPNSSEAGHSQHSPFKVCSSSTPISRMPLRENVSSNIDHLLASDVRRRLSLNQVEEVDDVQITDKENNDSAIGMMLNQTPSLDGQGSSTSKTSSPGDSGASSSNSPPPTTISEDPKGSTTTKLGDDGSSFIVDP